MVYALIMFAFNALGLPINKEAGMLSTDTSNSKETQFSVTHFVVMYYTYVCLKGWAVVTLKLYI